MLSFDLQCALNHEVVGQKRAVHTLVRAVALAMSGLEDPDGPAGTFLFVGPTGTGKTHLGRTLIRHIHGDLSRLVSVDCSQLRDGQEWAILERQLSSRFDLQSASGGDSVLPALTMLMLENIDRARPDFVRTFITCVQSGTLQLSNGKRCGLRGSLVLMTSNMCSDQIFEAGRKELGFSSPSGDEKEKARVYQFCVEAAQKRWGKDILALLDDLIVFHPLGESHVPLILDRLADELNQRLAQRHLLCEIDASAKEFLAQRAQKFQSNGAWYLVKVLKRFVWFPLADLVASRELHPGALVHVTCEDGERLQFDVSYGGPATPEDERGHRVPIGADSDVG
ncbi:MAG: ATP-dependent Clp protease ATP-binding subunit [bacterium]|nr:ATP-dependent Clp protease ATP-binding subunit [bacterium]